MKKMTLEDRISLGYILLFLLLMLISNVALVYILQRESQKTLITSALKKTNEINEFLNRVKVIQERYGGLTIQFNPKFDGQKIVYQKPFNPGDENYLYLLNIVNSVGTSQLPLATVNGENDDETNKKIFLEVEQQNIIENDPTKGKDVRLSTDGRLYYVFKISREINDNKFTNYIFKDITQERRLFRRLEWLSGIASILGVLGIVVGSKFLSIRILRPVNNIIKTAETITTDDLSKRIESPKTGDELEKLTTIINQMLDRIENSFENQSKFVSDASHELRTPLAIIKGYAEIIKKRKLSNTEIFEESIDSIINEADNMKNLVQKLLFLAKGEISKVNASFREIQVNEMIEQLYSDMKVSVSDHEFILEKSENYKVRGEETLLLQAIRALIENAIKYSDLGTKIFIKSEIKDGFGKISIRDQGVGINIEDKKRIFDRFYRVDDSRTKSTGGSGLGLAIVKRIVEIHDGKIEIESEYEVGTEISVVLSIIESKNEQIIEKSKENMVLKLPKKLINKKINK